MGCLNFYAVDGLCAVDLNSFNLPVTEDEALAILTSKGFKVADVDIIIEARKLIGRTNYKFGAKLLESPGLVDCSGFVKNIYGSIGVWVPRRTIQQFTFGLEVNEECLVKGDLIFAQGRVASYYLDDPSEKIGHVAIFTGKNSVIEATDAIGGVGETDLDDFLAERKIRGFRRIIPDCKKIITLICPPAREIEQSDDIKWVILQSL